MQDCGLFVMEIYGFASVFKAIGKFLIELVHFLWIVKCFYELCKIIG